MREMRLTPESLLYTKLIPNIDFKKVYKKTQGGWVLLKNCHLNTGFVKKHLEGYHILGYSIYRNVTKHFVIDIDAHDEFDRKTVYDRYFEVVDRLGHPSFVVTSSKSGGLHVYYIFENYYYPKDLQASLTPILQDIRGIDILPSGTSNIRLPFGKHSNLTNTDDPHMTYAHLSKEKQIEMTLQYINIYEVLEDVNVVHKKVTRQNDCQYEELNEMYRYTHSQSLNLNYPSIGFYQGNRYNSLIQIFNKSRSKEEYLSLCSQEDAKMFMYKNPSRDLIRLANDRRMLHYDKFYEGMLVHSKKDSSKPVRDPNCMKTTLNMYQVTQIRKWLMKLPELKDLHINGLAKRTTKMRFINFSLKVINEFQKQATHYPGKRSYALPSLFLKALDTYYYKFWSILRKYITITDKEYFHGTVGYRCREFNIHTFKDFMTRLLKYKTLSIKYYYNNNSTAPSSAPRNPTQNHYNILPDVFKKIKGRSDIMKDIGCELKHLRTTTGEFRSRWVYNPVLVH